MKPTHKLNIYFSGSNGFGFADSMYYESLSLSKLIKNVLPVVFLVALFSSAADSPQLNKPDSGLVVTVDKIKFKNTKIDVIFILQNNSATDLDLSRAIWRANSNGHEGSIKHSELDGIMLGSKQKRRGAIIFDFEQELPRVGPLDLKITNIKTLEGASISDVILKYRSETSRSARGVGSDSRFQDPSLMRWILVN